MGVGPLLRAEEDRGRPVGERRGVAGRHGGALALAEHGLERPELLEGGSGAQVLVDRQAQVRGEEVVEEATLVGGGEVDVAGQGQLVLGLTGDPPLRSGQRHVVTHRQPRAGLGVRRHRHAHVGRTERQGRLHAVGRGLGPVQAQQLAAQRLGDDDGGVGGGVGPTRDARLDLTEGDLVRHEDGGLEPGAAGLGDVVGGGGRRQAGAEDGLTGEVEVPAVLDDRARDDLSEAFPGEAVAGDEALDGRGEHVLVRGLRVGAELAGERGAVAAEDGGAAGGGHRKGSLCVGRCIRYGR